MYVLASFYGITGQQAMQSFIGPAVAAALQDCAFLVNETNRVKAANMRLRSENKRLDNRHTQDTTHARRHFDSRVAAQRRYETSQKALQDIMWDLQVGLGQMPAPPSFDAELDNSIVETINELISELVSKSKATHLDKEKTDNALVAPADTPVQRPASSQSLSAQLELLDPLENFYHVIEEFRTFASWHPDILENHIFQRLLKVRAAQIAAGVEETQWGDNDLAKAMTFWNESSVEGVHNLLDHGPNGEAILKKYCRVLTKVKPKSNGKQTEYVSLPDFYAAIDNFEYFGKAKRDDMRRNLNKIKSNSQAADPEEERVKQEDVRSAMIARDRAMLEVTRHLSATTLNENATPEQHGKTISKTNDPSPALRPLTAADFNTAEIIIKLHIYNGGDISHATIQDAAGTAVRTVASVTEYDAVNNAAHMMMQVQGITKPNPMCITVKKNPDSAGDGVGSFAYVLRVGYGKWTTKLFNLVKANKMFASKYVATIDIYASASDVVSKEDHAKLLEYLGPIVDKF